jgi:hypothetical protein
MSETYSEDEAIIRLSVEELTKFANALSYFINHEYEPEALILAVGNSVELDDNIGKIVRGYDESAVPKLKEIVSLITQILPMVKDRVLHDMLESNLKNITDFFTRFSIKYDGNEDQKLSYLQRVRNPFYKCESPELDKLIRSMVDERKTKPCAPLSDNWGALARGIRDSYEGNVDQPRPDIDTFVTEGLRRYNERKKEYQRIKNSQRVGSKYELSYQANPREYFRKHVLEPLSARICEEYRQ